MFTEAAILDIEREADRAALKREELNKLSLAGTWSVGNRTFEITDFGVERGALACRAKVTVDGSRYSLGKREVTIENIRVPNPRVVILSGDPRNPTRTFNPALAQRQVIAQAVGLLLRKPINVERERIGRTTTVLYPDAGDSTGAGVDGFLRGATGTTDWASLVASAGTSADTTATNNWLASWDPVAGGFRRLYRGVTNADTTLPGQVVTAATWSLYLYAVVDANGDTPALHCVGFTGNADTLTTADFAVANFGATSFGSLAYGSITGSAYNDFVMNASGLAAIDTGGISKFGWRVSHDLLGTTPTLAANSESGFGARYADFSGTTSDPKLTIEHEDAPAGGSLALRMLLG